MNAVYLSDSRRLLATLIRLGWLLVELLDADRHKRFADAIARKLSIRVEHRGRGPPEGLKNKSVSRPGTLRGCESIGDRL